MGIKNLAKPSRTRRVGDGTRSCAIARSSRGEIRHPRFGLTAPPRHTQAVRSPFSRTRSLVGRAASPWAGLARLGEGVGDAQGRRLRNEREVGNRDLIRHDRCVGTARPGSQRTPSTRIRCSSRYPDAYIKSTPAWPSSMLPQRASPPDRRCHTFTFAV